ncbi:hypothetical protein Bca4012_056179 [Brassica carinata]
MAVPTILLADFKARRPSNTVGFRLPCSDPVRSHSIAFLPLKRSKTVCLSGFEVQASQLHQSLLRGGNNHPSGDAILGAIWVSCVCSYSQKLTETDIAIGSGEVPVNPTPLLNETTTTAKTTLTKGYLHKEAPPWSPGRFRRIRMRDCYTKMHCLSGRRWMLSTIERDFTWLRKQNCETMSGFSHLSTLKILKVWIEATNDDDEPPNARLKAKSTVCYITFRLASSGIREHIERRAIVRRVISERTGNH